MQSPADALAGLVVTTGGTDYYISDHSTHIDDVAAAADAEGFGTGWTVREESGLYTSAMTTIDSLSAAVTPWVAFDHSLASPHYILRSFSDFFMNERVAARHNFLNTWSASYETVVPKQHASGHWVLTRTSSGAVPEPSTFLGFCLVGLAFGGRRKLKSDS